MAYKGYRIRIDKDSGRGENEQVDVASTKEFSFNPNGSYSAQGGSSGSGGGEKVNTLKGGAMNAVLSQTAKKALNYGLSNYGNLTGDYVSQANSQGIIEIGGVVATALTGPIGAVAVAGDLAFREISRQIELSNKNRQVEFLRARTGMIGYSGGR